MKSLAVTLAIGLSVGAISTSSRAMDINYEVSCLKQKELTTYLGRAFNETRIAEGALENGHRIEIFAAHDGSWTMIEFPGDGYGCIHSYGHGLRVERAGGNKPAS